MTRREAVNDFVVKFANVNGSGSASANHLFAKSVFRMGIPVSPRNIFPSNIQGMPTWYEVRINDQGYLSRRGGGVDLMVSINPQSLADDVTEVLPGGYFIYDSTRPLDPRLMRDDVNFIGLPLTETTNAEYDDARLRQLFKNIIYVGALAAMLDMDFSAMKQLIADQFKNKPKLIEPNVHALELGHRLAQDHCDCPLGLRVETRDLVGDQILVDGNTACGIGAIYGGATVAAWYPITPSTTVAETFERYADLWRTDPDSGEKRFMVIQAEDELAAFGMVLGAGWNGARAFTSTSGPGVSLMSEMLGLGYFAEIPAVLINVQRAGPSTGMPTRTQQSDLIACAYASHGDTRHVLLFPSDPNECFLMTADALDLADQLQTPIILMSDLDLGMNDTTCAPFEWDDAREYQRGKVLDADDLDLMGQKDEAFGRFLDVDGDGIAYRTYPGTHPSRGAYFTRGTARDAFAHYTEKASDYKYNVDRLLTKWATAVNYLPAPVREYAGSGQPALACVIHFGTSRAAVFESLDQLRADGLALDELRIRAFPFHDTVREFIEAYEQVIVVEQNRDGQMRKLLMNELDADPRKLHSVLHYEGTPISANTVTKQIRAILEGAAPHRHSKVS